MLLLMSRMMVAEEPVAVLVEIPDDEDVDDENDQHVPTGMALAREFVDLDGDEKGRLPNGQPAGPTGAEDHPDSLGQSEKAVDEGAGRRPKHIHLGQAADF